MKIRTKVATVALTGAMVFGATGTAFAAASNTETNDTDTTISTLDIGDPDAPMQPGEPGPLPIPGDPNAPMQPGEPGPHPIGPGDPNAPEQPGIPGPHPINPPDGGHWAPPVYTGTIAWNTTDARVGTERVVTVSGLNAGETVTMTLRRPDGRTITLRATANRKGVATFTFTPDQVGKYTWAITRTFKIPAGFKGQFKTMTVTIGEGSFRSFGRGHGGGNKGDNKCDHGVNSKDCDKGHGSKPKPGAPAPVQRAPKHPVTGAPAALMAVGGGLLATTGGTLLIAQKRRNDA